MRNKNLIIAGTSLGIAGGIFVTLSDILTLCSFLASIGLGIAIIFLSTLVKIAILVFGIVALNLNMSYIGKAPNILLIVGGALSLVPGFALIGGILAIIAGGLYSSGLHQI